MAQASKNMKFVPLRVSQLLPDILAAVQDEEEEEYGSESDEDAEYPDKSFSDGDVMEYNKGFYGKSGHKADVTHPISNSRPLNEHNVEEYATNEIFYNQTYPNKESQSASANKNKSKLLSTPLRTPNKHNTVMKQVTASGRSVRGGGATPRSSNKKKTPRYMKGMGMSACKSSAKKTTPFRKCLNLEDAFKSSTKGSLFSTSKKTSQPTPRQPHASSSKEHSERERKPPIKPTSLDEIFASALQIGEEQQKEQSDCEKEKESLGMPQDRHNPFGNKVNQKNYHNMFATPKTNVTSNSIIKGCRDNNFITPLKPTDISGIHKYETPGTQQNNNSLFRNQQTPLFTIKEKSGPTQKHSMKKVEMSTQRKNKENHSDKDMDKDVQLKKSLFKDISDVHDKLAVLKEVQNSTGKTPILKPNSNFKQDSTSKKLIAEPSFNVKKDDMIEKPAINDGKRPHFEYSDGKPHFFSSQPKQFSLVDSKDKFSSSNNAHAVVDNLLDPSKDNQYPEFVSSKPQICDRVIETNQFLNKEHQNNEYNRRQEQQNLNIEYQNNLDNRLSVECNNQRQQQLSVVDGHLNSKHGTSSNKMNEMQNRLVSGNAFHHSTQQQSLKQHSNNVPRNSTQQLAGTGRQFKTLTIKGKQYIVLGSLGSGGSSEVFKVMDPNDSSMYAVKCVNLAVEQSVAQSYVNEIKLLQRLQGSDRVITMYDYEFVDKRMLYVVLEMGDVDLSKLMKGYRARESRLPLPILMCYWTEMLTAVRHIHQNGIIHSDLKPANFLLVHGRLKLIDFGIASSLNADATSVLKDSTTGTFNYISPEAVNAGSEGRDPIKISYKSDVWSLGCILYGMLYGRTPFSHVTHIIAKIRALCNPHQPIDYPEIQGVPPVLMQALRWCLTHDVKKRPSVQQLIELPYMGEIPRPVPANNKKLPISILLKIKNVLTAEELECLTQVLEGK